MTPAMPSPGAPASSAPTTATTTSVNLPPVPPRRGPAASGHPPSEPGSSLYALGIQAQDIAGEIATAATLLDSDDPAEQQAAIDLIETYLAAQDHTLSLVFDKADNVIRYIDHLRAVAAFRADQAARLAELAAADKRRADQLTDYTLKVLTTLQPEATKFSLPTHELRSRKSTAVEITDETLIPEHLRQEPKPRADMPPSKSAIKAVLAAGSPVPGAALVERRSWSIK